MTCGDCSAAQATPHYGGYHASCRGCRARMLAASPAYYTAQKAGRLTAEYKRLLTQQLGEDVEASHREVKAWSETLRRLNNPTSP